MSAIDMELKRAFAELQVKAIETAQKLKMADIQIDSLKRIKHHAFVTETEISTLDSSTKTYESVGRMFVLTPLEEVKENLKKKQSTAEGKVKSLDSNKTYLERNLKDFENNIREMVHQRK